MKHPLQPTMILRTMSHRFIAAVALISLCILSPISAQAGIYSWGDFAGTDVTFLDVAESNGDTTSYFAPMPGTGGPVAIGNALHLDPQVFLSQSVDGEAHLLDSNLFTIIQANSGASIDSISISEWGDYSLSGPTGKQASAQVGAAFFLTILEIDNIAVSMATQALNLIVSTGGGVNGGEYVHPLDDGTAVIWNGVANFNLSSYLAGESISGKATKVRLTFDNTVQTFAEELTTAFIRKKGVDITVNPNVPEPASLVLLGLGLICLPYSRRRHTS